MSDGLGLILSDDHEQTVNSFHAVPVAFGAAPSDLPPRWFPPLMVESQGRTNSCVGHAGALACAHANFVATGEALRFSRRFAYITAQSEGGFIGADGGTSILSTLLATTKYGCCLESDCPFQEQYDTRISKRAYDLATLRQHLGETRYDCRSLETAMRWVSDKRPIVIGTRWMSGQDACSGIEDKRCGTSGSFRGYHGRLIVGWDTIGGELVPVCQNSHGQRFADHGRSRITPDLWHEWQKDSAFFALGFNRIEEVEPTRKSWSQSQPGDAY